MFNRAAALCNLATALLGTAALVGWWLDWPTLTRFEGHFIPMAPSTAMGFVLLGVALHTYLRFPRHPVCTSVLGIAGVTVAIMSLWIGLQFVPGLSGDVEGLVLQTSERLGEVPVGRMSPLTAGAFILASCSVILLWASEFKKPGLKRHAAIPAGLVLLVGTMVVLGYLYGTPLLYGGLIIPVALPTGIAFALLGSALIAPVGPDSSVVRNLVGDSVRARLMRSFLPMVVVVILVEGWIRTLLLRGPYANPALVAVLSALVAAAIAGALVSRFSSAIGGRIDRIEADLRTYAAALEQSQERYRLLAESALTGVYLIQDDLFRYVNPALASIFGYATDEIIGRLGPTDLTAPEDRERVAENIRKRVAREARDIRYSFRGLRKDGSTIEVEVHGTRIDYEGRPAVVGTLLDVTERRRADQEIGLLQTMTFAVSAAPDVDAALRIVLHKVCEATGWTYGEAWVPRPDGRVLECSPAWYGTTKSLEGFRSLSQGFTFAAGVGLPGRVWASGQPVWIRDVSADQIFARAPLAREAGLNAAVGVPVKVDDEVVVVLAFFLLEPREEDERLVRLVSAVAVQLGSVLRRKRVEEQIRRLNAELEQRVVERTAQLEAANKELEAFSYSVSHDLRAPLRSLDGFSRILLEDHATRLDDEGKSHLARIRAASQRMGHLIDDLLDLSRVTRTALQHTRVDLSALARSVTQELQQSRPDRRVAFEVHDGLVTEGDERLLRVVLENLFGNSWKFTSKQPDARIEFGTLGHDSGRVFFVRDNGAGFDMAYAAKLFAPFQRLHKTTEFSGSGIGLATVQRIIHRHGGRVWAEGLVDHGATFYFTLER